MSQCNKDGYYYRPRVDLELIMSLPSEDVFITSACIAFNKYDDIDDIIFSKILEEGKMAESCCNHQGIDVTEAVKECIIL